MLGILDKIMGGVVLSYVLILFWSMILNKKINYKSFSFYICLIVLVLATTLNYYLVNNFLKIIFISIFMIVCCLMLFKTTIKESVLTIFIEQIIFMISDGFVAIIFTFVLNLTYTDNLYISSFLINLFASVIALLLFHILFVKKIYNFLYKITKKIKNVEVIVLCFFIIIFADVFGVASYNKVNFRVIILINIIFTLLCFVIVLYSLKNKNNYNKVYNKYNTTLNSLKEYELMVDTNRITSHENKNQLLTIRNMLTDENKEVKLYIDKILNNKQKDDDNIMLETVVIPSGGLRGLIYSKLLLMNTLKIKYQLLISNEIKTLNLLDLDDDLMLDICKIIGVYLDNAINAVKKLKKKYINIEMYKENNQMIISISNNYSGYIDIENIDEIGYTSNGEGHGYGLALVKQIITNNKKISNQRKLSKDIFSQILKIDI